MGEKRINLRGCVGSMHPGALRLCMPFYRWEWDLRARRWGALLAGHCWRDDVGEVGVVIKLMINLAGSLTHNLCIAGASCFVYEQPSLHRRRWHIKIDGNGCLQVVLLTEKEDSTMWKALSTQLRQGMAFAQVGFTHVLPLMHVLPVSALCLCLLWCSISTTWLWVPPLTMPQLTGAWTGFCTAVPSGHTTWPVTQTGVGCKHACRCIQAGWNIKCHSTTACRLTVPSAESR